MLTHDEMFNLELRIKTHEGFRGKPYTDAAGKLSIGYGRNLTDVGISRGEADLFLRGDINVAILELQRYPWFALLNAPRQAALIDMMVNLGATKFSEFTQMIDLLQAGQHDAAAHEMRASLWATQVGARADKDADQLASGEWSKSA